MEDLFKIKNVKIDEKINLLHQMINDLQDEKTTIKNKKVTLMID